MCVRVREKVSGKVTFRLRVELGAALDESHVQGLQVPCVGAVTGVQEEQRAEVASEPI